MITSPPGKLIVFEGIDGTGKTTQLSLLARTLCQRGLPVISTREPTDGIYGRKIRELYRDRERISRREELELFVADRREHVRELLEPALQSGKIVLCDRYVFSTLAYQGAVGLDQDEILRQNSFAPIPDLVLLFQASPETGIARITGRRHDSPNDFEQADTLVRVARIFDALDQPYIHRIDATGAIATIHESVMSAVEHIIHQYHLR